MIIGRRGHSLYLGQLWSRCAAANRVALTQFEYIKLLSLPEGGSCVPIFRLVRYAKSEIESGRDSCFRWISKIQSCRCYLSLSLSPSSDFPLESIGIISIIFYEFVIASVRRYLSRCENRYPIEVLSPSHVVIFTPYRSVH